MKTLKKYKPLKLGTKPELHALMDSQFQCEQQLLVFYSSQINRLVTDPSLMVIPFYDRMNIRGHSIFDTVNVRRGKFMSLKQHMDRLENSLALTYMKLPMPLEEIQVKLAMIAEFCYENYKEIDWQAKQINIRYWVSSGLGDLNIVSKDQQSILYVIATSRDIYPAALEGIKDYSISLDGIEFKQGAIAKAKTNNYMHNALVAKTSSLRGGFIGIMLDENGYIIEGSIGNVAFVTNENQFLIPESDNKLEGTTLKNAMKKIKEMIETGLLKEIIEIAIKPCEIYHKVKEMIIFKGDDVIPVLEFDDVKISESKGIICAQVFFPYFQIIFLQLQQYMFDQAELDAVPIQEFLNLVDKTQIEKSPDIKTKQKKAIKYEENPSKVKFQMDESNIMQKSKDSNNNELYRIRSSSCCNDLILDSSPVLESKEDLQKNN